MSRKSRILGGQETKEGKREEKNGKSSQEICKRKMHIQEGNSKLLLAHVVGPTPFQVL